MIDFVDTPPFFKIALQFAMTTMHFHIAQTGLFMGKLFSHSGGPRHQCKIVLDVQGRSS